MTAASLEPTREIGCEACGAVLRVDAHDKTLRCPYCAAPAVIERADRETLARPTFVVGFVLPRDHVLRLARTWVRRAWFAPRTFRNAAFEDVRGVYLPSYVYTAAAEVEFSAEIGENYTVVETYTTTNAQGKSVTRTRTKIKTEWRPLRGPWFGYVADVVVTASRGLSNAELGAVEPFDLRELRRYTPELLSGWIAEEPSLSDAESLQFARDEGMEQLAARLHRHMPGDSHRNLRYQASLTEEDLELVLLPVWVLAVRYDPQREPVRLIINGQTGRAWGRPPRSPLKITLAIASLVGLVALLVFLARGGLG